MHKAREIKPISLGVPGIFKVTVFDPRFVWLMPAKYPGFHQFVCLNFMFRRLVRVCNDGTLEFDFGDWYFSIRKLEPEAKGAPYCDYISDNTACFFTNSFEIAFGHD